MITALIWVRGHPQLRFCRERPQKAIHRRELDITHFIDDRADVLIALEGIVPCRYRFGPQRKGAPHGVVPVLTRAEGSATVDADLVRRGSETRTGISAPA